MEVSEFRRKLPGEVSLLTYNIVGGMKIEQVITDILSLPEKPEIICFQEYPIEPSANTLFKKAFEDYHFKEKPLWQMSTGTVGIATLLRKELIEIRETKIINLPVSSGHPIEQLFLRLATGKQIPMMRAALITRIRIGEREILIVNTHLSFEGAVSYKINQLNSIFNDPVVRGFRGPTIIAGDFNLIAKSRGEKILHREAFKHNFSDFSTEIFPTYNFLNLTSFPEDRTIWLRKILTYIPRKLGLKIGVKLDYILGRNIKATFCRPLPYNGSDHYPLLTYFTD